MVGKFILLALLAAINIGILATVVVYVIHPRSASTDGDDGAGEVCPTDFLQDLLHFSYTLTSGDFSGYSMNMTHLNDTYTLNIRSHPSPDQEFLFVGHHYGGNITVDSSGRSAVDFDLFRFLREGETQGMVLTLRDERFPWEVTGDYSFVRDPSQRTTCQRACPQTFPQMLLRNGYRVTSGGTMRAESCAVRLHPSGAFLIRLGSRGGDTDFAFSTCVATDPNTVVFSDGHGQSAEFVMHDYGDGATVSLDVEWLPPAPGEDIPREFNIGEPNKFGC